MKTSHVVSFGGVVVLASLLFGFVGRIYGAQTLVVGPCGNFWSLQHLLAGKSTPPMPVNVFPEMNTYQVGSNAWVVDDLSIDYESLNAQSMEMTALEGDEENSGEGFACGAGVFTDAPETVLFNTMNSSSNGLLASWRDVRAFPVPEGMALGIVIQTNFPFEITKIEAEVVFENPESLPDTEFEVGFFRGTNQFQFAMYLDPDYTASDVEGTVSLTLTNLAEGLWLLSLDLPTYAWGTNRVLTIRTVPNSDGTMAKMSLIASSNTVPGVAAYSSDNSNNIVQVPLPKMQVWSRVLSSIRAVSYEKLVTDLEISILPGYQLGSSTNLASSWNWQTDELRDLRALVDTREGQGFFIMRPDASD